MKHSLITKITIFFVTAIILVCVLFITFGRIQMNKALGSMQANQINAVNYLLESYKRNNPPQDIESYFSNFGLELVKDKNLVQNVLISGKKYFAQETAIGEISSIEYNNTLFLNIKNNSMVVVFESIGTKNLNDPLWVGFLITIVVLFSLYLSILRSFAPLKKLSKNIKQFSLGNLEIDLKQIRREDEIGQVAHEFNNAIIKIQELIRSRQLFLRTIMHELKTPIGKGRLITEMLDDETQKTRLVAVFERLEILINEFAKIEQLLSKSYTLNYQKYHFSLILEQVRDMSMLDKWDSLVAENIEDDAIINVDFGLFALAIKNLIDNGLKYSSDHHVSVICDENKISVANHGAALEKSFEHYKQAFIRNKNEKATGMGLGLYIIDKICDLHKFSFTYNYSDNTHYFSIIFNNPGSKK
ncbi:MULTISPECIES: ArsS family sensor histidine kinase [unclassified Campylobacter]|uniref:ArsS family sensor histidine kinase n=1 Tax=unclassified Campylobacter TaxID=2593542 RepID=UPI0022E9AE43|nr:MULTISPECIES: ArsS family sensor histidine kinase [unclassified Campylobacter]MDA3047778.1 ArsS family sensor histidine kinase [Campylobacter sp. JMF_08 NE1]MDA3062316.1 ArsS family sensor histidine kinase [Campylobacter sp. JMF_14 EL1]MDA3073565.1 ArsS family sensor histidine kinase [Campylobacter sp. JMF_10 EL2]